jgi:hypothetical protein
MAPLGSQPAPKAHSEAPAPRAQDRRWVPGRRGQPRWDGHLQPRGKPAQARRPQQPSWRSEPRPWRPEHPLWRWAQRPWPWEPRTGVLVPGSCGSRPSWYWRRWTPPQAGPGLVWPRAFSAPWDGRSAGGPTSGRGSERTGPSGRRTVHRWPRSPWPRAALPWDGPGPPKGQKGWQSPWKPRLRGIRMVYLRQDHAVVDGQKVASVPEGVA